MPQMALFCHYLNFSVLLNKKIKRLPIHYSSQGSTFNSNGRVC